MYRITFTEDAKKDVKKLDKKAPRTIPKLAKLLEELKKHPAAGTGQIELIKYYKEKTYSRRISHAHRLVYRIDDDEQVVIILSCYGHYADK